MLHLDVLSAYLICGISALAGAAMLPIARTDDPGLRKALRWCGQSFVIFGIGLLPFALGPLAAHPAAQLWIGVGSLSGVVLMARGLGELQSRAMPNPLMWGLIGMLVAATAASVGSGTLAFGRFYACGLAVLVSLMAWYGRGFVLRPRDRVEKGLALSLVLVMASSWLRVAFTFRYEGPPRADLLYVPPLFAFLLGALYGVIPFVLATLLLSLVNTRLHQQLHRRATTDELTGVLTRRALRELAPPLIEAERARQRDLAVLMLDLDHFKDINDSAGHGAGDAVLRLVASVLKAHLRRETLLARYGGEEFVAVAPVDDLAAARRVSERLRDAVETSDWKSVPGLHKPVTVSVGVALVGPGEDLDQALRRADEALYRAKREGRNRVQVSLMLA